MSATQLYYTLLWPKEPPPLVDRLLQQHMMTLKGWLDDAIWLVRHNDPALYDKFSEAVGNILDEERDRFLLAPSVFSLLSAAKALQLDECRGVLLAYQQDILLARGGVFAGHGWSRLTDFLQINEADRRYNEVIGDSVIIDFDSDECLRMDASSSVFCRPPVPVSSKERELILEKLHAALRLIDETSSTAGKLIRNVTRCIRVRKSSAEMTAAETDPQVIGEMRLHNPQRDDMRLIDLVDSLIHESLHSFLAMYELQFGSFVGYAQSAMVRPVSPWSGNPIPYNAFTHAVFIYFSIFNFYRMLYPQLKNSEERNNVAELMTRCSRGFRLIEPGKCLSLVGTSPEWLHNVYHEMTLAVRRHYRDDMLE